MLDTHISIIDCLKAGIGLKLLLLLIVTSQCGELLRAQVDGKVESAFRFEKYPVTFLKSEHLRRYTVDARLFQAFGDDAVEAVINQIALWGPNFASRYVVISVLVGMALIRLEVVDTTNWTRLEVPFNLLSSCREGPENPLSYRLSSGLLVVRGALYQAENQPGPCGLFAFKIEKQRLTLVAQSLRPKWKTP